MFEYNLYEGDNNSIKLPPLLCSVLEVGCTCCWLKYLLQLSASS